MKTPAQLESEKNILKAGLANQLTIDALNILRQRAERDLLSSAPVASDPNGFWAHNGIGRLQEIDYIIRYAERLMVENDKKK